jgi:hypothetical protein
MNFTNNVFTFTHSFCGFFAGDIGTGFQFNRKSLVWKDLLKKGEFKFEIRARILAAGKEIQIKRY